MVSKKQILYTHNFCAEVRYFCQKTGVSTIEINILWYYTCTTGTTCTAAAVTLHVLSKYLVSNLDTKDGKF